MNPDDISKHFAGMWSDKERESIERMLSAFDEPKPKPKCPVFGCTIPRGIPHEHPAGVSAVMRDPAGPLNADERAELERYRAAAEKDLDEDAKRLRDILLSQARGMQHVGPGSQVYDRAMGTNYYVVPADAKIHGGRKLRDALLMAGHNEWCRRRHIDPVSGETFEAIQKRELLATTPAPRRSFFREMFEVPHRSFIHLVGHIAFAVVCTIGLYLAAFVLAVSMGWLP